MPLAAWVASFEARLALGRDESRRSASPRVRISHQETAMKTSLDHYPPATSLPPRQALGPPSPSKREQFSAQGAEASIALTTSEGDRISIRQLAHSQQSHSQSTTGQGLRTVDHLLAASGMSIEVQGDLNEQELADLTKLLGDLNAIATDFFRGNMEGAVAGAMNIGDMGSIDKLEATFTRTTVLSQYLETPHPMPAMSPPNLDALLTDEPIARQASAEAPSMLASLTAQWQQFIDELTNPEPPPRPDDLPPALPAAVAGQQMLERSTETIINTPRLTPLLPSLADLAIQQAVQHYGQKPLASQLAADLSRYFTKSFNAWLL